MKNVIRQLLYRFGYRIRRLRPENRFQALEDTFRMLKARGMVPDMIIDGGANVGAWTVAARRFFPDSQYHLIEPQPACLEVLRRIPNVNIHPVALCAPGVTRVRIVGGGVGGRGTGAHIASVSERASAGEGEIEAAAATLDALLAEVVQRGMRVLLKLDLEGHELAALRGAEQLIKLTELIFTEINFYDPQKWGRCVFAEMFSYLLAHDFEILDITSLSSRRRDERLRQGDVLFARRNSPLIKDISWS